MPPPTSGVPDAEAAKAPFDIHVAMERIREAVEPFPKAALFELADEGFGSPFQQLVGCIISIRTRDEAMIRIARRLFNVARLPEEVARLTPGEIEALIHGCAFYEGKARQIHAVARAVVEEHGGNLPCDFETLTSFNGVGPKCANLVLGIACGEAEIGVDIHVHRVTNRWGYVQTCSPEATMAALYERLPREYRVEINRLLVPFGKHICTGKLPKCSTCPLLDMCRTVGVTEHR